MTFLELFQMLPKQLHTKDSQHTKKESPAMIYKTLQFLPESFKAHKEWSNQELSQLFAQKGYNPQAEIPCKHCSKN